MSVLSKALSVALVVSPILGFATGCATTPDGYIDTSSVETGADRNNGVIADQAMTSLDNVKSILSAEDDGIGLDLVTGEGYTQLVLEPSGMQDYEVSRMDSPARLIIDIPGYQSSETRTIYLDGSEHVSAVRTGQSGEDGRIVFDLSETSDTPEGAAVPQLVERQGEKLLVSFGEAGNLEAVDQQARMPEDLELEAEEIAAEETEEVVASLATEEELSQPSEVSQDLVDTSEEQALVIENSEPEDVNAEIASFQDTVLDTLRFTEGTDGLSAVHLELSSEVPFDLKRTTPTEYVLTLPGVTASKRTLLPQLAPDNSSGIRSARAVQEGPSSVIRMFVSNDINLLAKTNGSEIVIEATKVNSQAAAANDVAQQPDARAQLGEEAEETESSNDTARVNPTGIVSDDGKKLYTGRLISLDLQDTDIDNALRIIAEVSNLNIIASDDVTGKVTLRLIDVPWDQALDVILKTNGLDQVTEGNVIRIAPVDKLRQEREARREAKQALENLEELKVSYYRISYARATEIQEQVEGILTERGTVTVDERTNQVIVKDIKKGQAEALALIARLDLRTPQILLETQIVEGERSILRDLGFQWNFNLQQAPEFGNATGLNFPNSVGVGGSTAGSAGALGGNLVDFPSTSSGIGAGSAISMLLDSADGSRSLGARLTAVEQEGRARIISRPQIATVNNKQAVIKSVETLRVKTPDSGTSVATGAGSTAAGGGGNAFEEIEVGIKLTVTPNASPDYYVLLDIDAESSTIGGGERVDGIPPTVERTANSTILVQSGQTFALGGVYRIEDNDTIAGVPWLKDIPFFGAMFRNTLVDKQDEELIFFITPHIVEGSFDPSLM